MSDFKQFVDQAKQEAAANSAAEKAKGKEDSANTGEAVGWVINEITSTLDATYFRVEKPNISPSGHFKFAAKGDDVEIRFSGQVNVWADLNVLRRELEGSIEVVVTSAKNITHSQFAMVGGRFMIDRFVLNKNDLRSAIERLTREVIEMDASQKRK
jgi:hypothetical protein